jgi:hypothetical protein
MPSKRARTVCDFCGEGVVCEHGKCSSCERCVVCTDPPLNCELAEETTDDE